jgi:hypothetical protein
VSLAVGGAASLALTIAVVALLRHPALELLRELCRAEHRARYWWHMSALGMATGAALGAVLGMLTSSEGDRWRAAVAMVRGDSAGLLAGAAVIAAAMLLFAAQLREGQRR